MRRQQIKIVRIVAGGALGLLLAYSPGAHAGEASELVVAETSSGYALSLGDDEPFHTTEREVQNARLIEVPDSTVLVVLWDEKESDERALHFYALSPDGDKITRVQQTTYELHMRLGEFDPDAAGPVIDPALEADEDVNLYVVQFVTQMLQDYRKALQRLGASVHSFLPRHAHIVKMRPEVRTQVEALPFVRAVVPFHPAYRLEEFMRDNLENSDALFPLLRYNIQVFDPAQKAVVAERIEAQGGVVDSPDSGKFLLTATLTPEQLLEVVRWDEVSFIDRWGPYETDMDVAREISGANFLETVEGFTGEGVRGEVFDNGFNLNHMDLQNPELIVHGGACTLDHGARSCGAIFGDGTGDAQARGLLPNGQGIVASYSPSCGGPGLTGENRYEHTRELVKPDLIYQAVFQTASVGSPQTMEYTTISCEMDGIVFDFDIVICQSQSNCGGSKNFCTPTCQEPRCSRPQAWAKNIISVGGIKHFNTLLRGDDTWCLGTSSCTSETCGSTGPASDGRLKPELAHFYDCIHTTRCCFFNSYTDPGGAGGTSIATPITCGYFGLMFQMWHEGVFADFGGGASVFDSRPRSTTARALMINTAYRYPLTQADFTRYNQGWGMVDVQKLYDLSDNDKIYIINEKYLLDNLSNTWTDFGVVVDAGEPELRVTLVYIDPPGTVSASRHAINDLSLKMTAPGGAVYWGNCGLRESNYSSSACTGPNPPDPDDLEENPILDTVENVFIAAPEAGVWHIRIDADEINQDAHPPSPQVNSAFALVVTGVSEVLGACCLSPSGCADTTQEGCAQQGGISFRADRTCATIEMCPEEF